MHDHKEAEMALRYDQALIGINNRNLKTLDVSINNTISIFEVVKAHKGPLLSESGIKDEKDAHGRRYRRQAAIGSPVCITIDHDTLKDNSVTFRLRDTMEQYRVDLSLVRDELFKLTNPAHFLHKK